MRKTMGYGLTLIMLSLTLCACGSRDAEQTVSGEGAETAAFESTDALSELFEVKTAALPVEEELFGSYRVRNGKVYYEVNYYESLIDQTGLVGNMPFEDKYNTQIRVYDMETGEDSVLYQYHEDDCVEIYELEVGEDGIAWAEQSGAFGWNLITLDFSTGAVVCEKEALDVNALSEALAEACGLETTVRLEESDVAKIDLSPGYAFSYGRIEDYLFVNQRGTSAFGEEGLYCFDMENKTYQKLALPEAEGAILLAVGQGGEKELYTCRQGGGEIEIIDIWRK